jgi:hydroxymethylpyrimidine pyrophosphatase-like HAD family hydrolase
MNPPFKLSLKGRCTNPIEVLPLGVNKAKALAVLTGTLGFELSQVAAIGDAANRAQSVGAA